MQRDAMAMGHGVMYIAPPPMLGGGAYQPHQFFADLFDEQTNSVGNARVRLDDLATIVHETRGQAEQRRRDLLNPWAWLRLAFERVVRFPRYVLRHAGFSKKVTDSTGARIVAVAWSLLVGAATIGGFVLAALK